MPDFNGFSKELSKIFQNLKKTILNNGLRHTAMTMMSFGTGCYMFPKNLFNLVIAKGRIP